MPQGLDTELKGAVKNSKKPQIYEKSGLFLVVSKLGRAISALFPCIKGAILMVPVWGRRLIGSARAHSASPTVITIVTASFVRS